MKTIETKTDEFSNKVLGRTRYSGWNNSFFNEELWGMIFANNSEGGKREMKEELVLCLGMLTIIGMLSIPFMIKKPKEEKEK